MLKFLASLLDVNWSISCALHKSASAKKQHRVFHVEPRREQLRYMAYGIVTVYGVKKNP